ncbi:MAG: sulfite exporter TauE/SafE family protein [Leucobacter sp.]
MTDISLDFSVPVWAMLVCGAVIIGISKTALPGANTIPIAILASVVPAKLSTGVMLMLLILGDAFALWMYRQHANWQAILRLAPAVVVGLILGTVFLALADDSGVRRVIGVILLLLVAITLWRRTASTTEPTGRAGALSRFGYGAMGGFTTMVANAGGPVMSMYFLAARFPVKVFLGTAAWFFAIVNVAKVPFSIGLGLITPDGLLLDLFLAPGVVAGAFAGRWIVSRISQKLFDYLILVITVAGALYLVLA